MFVEYDGVTLRDAVYAAAIADALGVPYEFMNRDMFECTDMVGYGTHNQPEGTWSDDTSMILATCKSLMDNNGEVVPEDIMKNFAAWLHKTEFSPHGEVFDIGNTTYEAIVTGVPGTSSYSNGNGSLMRIVPLVFTDCSDDEIRAVSALTHAHKVSTEGCVIFVNMMREALSGKPLEEVVHALKPQEPYEALPFIDTLSRDEIRSSGYVVDTLEAAVWCVLTSSNMKECMLKAVNLGSDTDTVACVAGALVVCKFGMDEIPVEWFNMLKTKAVIDACVTKR